MNSDAGSSLEGDRLYCLSKFLPHPQLVLLAGFAALTAVLAPSLQVAAKPKPSTAIDTLSKMFSPQIQATFEACEKQGGVNLAAGPDKDGSVICNNGWRKSPINYTSYVNTASDFLAASYLSGTLVGIQQLMQEHSELSPEKLMAYFNSPEFIEQVRQSVGKDVLKQGSRTSAKILADRVFQKMQPMLQSYEKLKTLIPTGANYTRIAENFCPPPGMSMEQARALVPGLSSVQIYAVCLQDSGLLNEFKYYLIDRVRKQTSP